MLPSSDIEPPVFITVVVINWNGGAHVVACLEALSQQTFRNFEVIVVDNGSTDGSPERIAAAHPAYRLLRQSENLGFAAANNLAAAQARGEWLALLNNDAIPDATWLAQLHAATAQCPAYSGFASRQLQAGDRSRLDGAGDVYHTSGAIWRAGFGLPFGPPWDAPREVFAPCAAAAIYRLSAFRAAGGFDPAFYCYVEDIDLGFRLQLMGHRFMYWPSAVVTHVGSATMGQTSTFARYHGHRNLLWCFVKNMPGWLLWRRLPAHVAMTLATLVLFTLRGEGGPIWQAKRDALRDLPRVWRQRRVVQRTRTVAPRELDRRMAHGWRSLVLRSKALP